VVDLLWDDAAFKRRVQKIAKERGLTMAQALEAAGITPRYFSRASEGRSTNLVLNLARALEVPPEELLGLPPRPPEEAPPTPPPVIDEEKLQRISIAARMMAAQVAALIYVASDNGAHTDPIALIETVMSRFNHVLVEGDDPKNRK
jgi:transcriptional regulator with XRE-family HTH domain